MNQINFNTFDLNLVRVFLALWEQRNVTAAADRLNLTQPAVSHALNRLRDQFSDPLFTRVGKSMEPTEAARRLYVPFSTSLATLRETISIHGEFDPARSERVFTIAMSDISETYILPSLLGLLEKKAPHVRLLSIQLEASNIDLKLRSAQVDMALGYLPNLTQPEFGSSILMRDWFVGIARKGHPLMQTELTLDHIAKIHFVEVAVHATGYEMVRSVLKQGGIQRNIRARIEHFSVLPEIVRNTDMVAIYPASVAAPLIASGAFIALKLPIDLPTIDVRLHFHSSFQNDPGIQWVRRALSELFADQDVTLP